MSGRQPSSYAYPRLWNHVEALGYVRSTRALKKLKPLDGFRPRFGTQFSNRLLETKFVPERPVLLDYNTAHDLLELIRHHHDKQGLKVVSGDTRKEIVRFNCKIDGLARFMSGNTSEHTDPVGDLAIKAGVSEEVIAQAKSGRLLPYDICAAIVSAANGWPGLKIIDLVPGRDGAPCNELVAIKNILDRLAK